MKKINENIAVWMTLLYLGVSQQAFAALPTPAAPSSGAPAGNWLNLIRGYAKDSGLVLGLVIAVAIFLWVAWILIVKFNEARAGRAEWGEVGLVAVIAGGVMVFTSYILTAASTVFA